MKTKKPEEKVEGTLLDVLEEVKDVKDSYVPEGFDSQDDFLQDMREEYEHDLKYDEENRTEALEDKKFAAGEQWDPIVLEQRKGLPNLVINNIPQFTSQLIGDWRDSRKAIKVMPSSEEDKDVATVRGDLIRSIESKSRASRVYDNAFESLVECGDGAFRVAVEYARDSVFDQDIMLRPIEDCLSVVWDRYSVDPTAKDARRCFVDDRIPKKEFERKWPDIDYSSLSESTEFQQDLMRGNWMDEKSYRVTEYWRLIERKSLLAMFENGKVFPITDENQEELILKNGFPVQTRVSRCTYAQMHLCTGFAILSGPFEYKLDRLPVVRMSGRTTNIGGKRVRFGLVRFMKDPIRMKNFWRSTGAEQLGYAPKAKWIAPASAVEGREDTFRKAHLTRDPLLVYNDDAETPPTLIPPPPVEASLLNEAAVNTQDMKDVTGIHDASLGIKSNEVSGRAINARQREGDIAALVYFDNANAALLEAGDVINQLIPQIYDATRTVRTLGEDDQPKFIRLNDEFDPTAIDMSVGEFDVVLSTGTSYSTKRVESAQAMAEMIQVYPQLMEIAGDIIVKGQDWPGAEKLAERIRKMIPQQFLDQEDQQEGGPPMPSPEEIQEMQMPLQQLAEENKSLKADRSIDERKLLVDGYNAETQRIRALSDNEVDNTKTNLEAIKMIVEGSKSIDELDIKREDISTRTATQSAPSSPAPQSQPQGGTLG